MKKIFLVFPALILGFSIYRLNLPSNPAESSIIPRKIYSETRYIEGDSSKKRFILWKTYIDSVYRDSSDPNLGIYMIVDSVLREDFYTDRKWRISIKTRYAPEFESKLNAYHLLLAEASCSDSASICKLSFPGEGDSIFPDTQENRNKLSRKWDETKVVYVKEPKYKKELKYTDIGERYKMLDSLGYIPDNIYEHVLIKVTIKNPKPKNGFDELIADTVLLGEVPKIGLSELITDKTLLKEVPKGFKWYYNTSRCPNVAAGEYLVLARIGNINKSSNMSSKCPVKDTKKNRQQLSEEWKKCQIWGKLKNRRKPVGKTFCGVGITY